MRFVFALSSCFALSTAVVVQNRPQRVSYDGYKVFRVSVGKEVAKVNDIVSSLGLTTWKGAPRAGAFADIVVPPTKLEAFADKVVGMDATTMHEDLGASISEESAFQVYASTLAIGSCYTRLSRS